MRLADRKITEPLPSVNRSKPSRVTGFGSTSGLVFTLFAISALALMFDWPGAALWAGIALLAFVLIGNGIIPCWLANRLQAGQVWTDPSIEGRLVAIALYGDGNIRPLDSPTGMPSWLAYSRIMRAAQLHRMFTAEGRRCVIVVTGDDTGASAADPDYGRCLERLNVPRTDVRYEARGRNTYAQTRQVAAILSELKSEAVVLVTAGLHMKRALLYARSFGMEAVPAPSDYVTGIYTLFPIAFNFAVTDIAFHQYVGIARFHIYNAFGLNVRKNQETSGTHP